MALLYVLTDETLAPPPDRAVDAAGCVMISPASTRGTDQSTDTLTIRALAHEVGH